MRFLFSLWCSFCYQHVPFLILRFPLISRPSFLCLVVPLVVDSIVTHNITTNNIKSMFSVNRSKKCHRFRNSWQSCWTNGEGGEYLKTRWHVNVATNLSMWIHLEGKSEERTQSLSKLYLAITLAHSEHEPTTLRQFNPQIEPHIIMC